MRRHWQYLKYVLRHKWFVFQAGLKIGVPIFILIFHDWDKFLPDEWFPYARTFYKSNGEKHYENSIEFARAWMKHQHRNKHHWQYWLNVDGIPLHLTNVLVWDKGNAQEIVERNSGGETYYELRDIDSNRMTKRQMEHKYVLEMIADWRGAGRAITGKDNIVEWYDSNYNNIKLHSMSRYVLDVELGLQGITFDY